MSKYRLIEAICHHNRTANPAYLEQFQEGQLENYLRRLCCLNGIRGRQSRWVREGETTAVVTGSPSRMSSNG